jgi:hypothetical protein
MRFPFLLALPLAPPEAAACNSETGDDDRLAVARKTNTGPSRGAPPGCQGHSRGEATYVAALPAEPQTFNVWDDPDRWELGASSPEDEPFEPEPSNRDWWAEQTLRSATSGPTDRDRDELAYWSDWADQFEQAHQITDEGVMR